MKTSSSLQSAQKLYQPIKLEILTYNDTKACHTEGDDRLTSHSQSWSRIIFEFTRSRYLTLTTIIVNLITDTELAFLSCLWGKIWPLVVSPIGCHFVDRWQCNYLLDSLTIFWSKLTISIYSIMFVTYHCFSSDEYFHKNLHYITK